MTTKTHLTKILLALIPSLCPLAAEEEVARSADELAKEMANPNTALTSLKLQTQFYRFDVDVPGRNDFDMVKLFLQPTLPFPLENGRTLWVRPGIPYIIDQPVLDSFTNGLQRETGLGDITLDVQYGGTEDNGFLWSVGLSAMFPTATQDGLGTDLWTLGPGFQLGMVSEKAILGMFVNHQWDIAGDGRSNPDRPYLLGSPGSGGASLTAIQLFGVYLPGNGWSLGTAPIMTFNHETSDWMIPLHFTVSKTVTINDRPWEFSLDLNYYLERPDTIAPEWMVGFNVAPVVENVFAKWFQ